MCGERWRRLLEFYRPGVAVWFWGHGLQQTWFASANFDVAGLNRELPDRVQKLQELQGDKLRK